MPGFSPPPLVRAAASSLACLRLGLVGRHARNIAPVELVVPALAVHPLLGIRESGPRKMQVLRDDRLRGGGWGGANMLYGPLLPA